MAAPAPPKDVMKEAARTLSRILSDNGIEHAIIGGFSLSLLGHERETLDIDVLVGVDVKELKNGPVKILCEADSRFVVSNLKLFFVPSGPNNWDTRVPIEMLSRGILGLPRRFTIMRPGDGSTRPQSVSKFLADTRDIVHLLHWLREHDQKIDFVNYDTASPERLYGATRALRKYWMEAEPELVRALDLVLQDIDKAAINDVV
ncbi:hypothetical protein ACRALDRAFT_1066677 [Sodiomyces alcalophilus JCM 7366]|uniref:uncharacterized protein n=1 Tax=Sodiomyces alcalophilus JCM 7366 TaxID=591952 RepID=UPI0039B65B79